MWRSEADQGIENAAKDRPCAVVLAVRQIEGKDFQVVVAPITHRQPLGHQAAIEIPRDTKLRLGLDDERSWIVTSDLNAFMWPGPDIRPVEHRGNVRDYIYGDLPVPLAKRLIEEVRKSLKAGKAKAVKRT